jgi:hypothetical protein
MKYYLILLLTCLSVGLRAQTSIDLFTLSGFIGTPTSYTEPLKGKATESGTLINLKVPIVLNSKTTWYSDFTHTFYSIQNNLKPEPSDILTSMNLHAFIFQTGIVQKLNERNGFQLLVVPRYTTDFEGSDSRNWQVGAIGLFEHRFKANLLMRFGVLYNGELFGPLLVPLIFADWQLSERWNINGMFPINLKVSYKINERLSTGYSHFGFITTYRINQDEFQSDYVERNSIDETLFLRWRLVGNFHLETRLGYSLSRVYEQYEQDQKMDLRLSLIGIGDNREQKNISFNSGPILSFRLIYNLPLNTEK